MPTVSAHSVVNASPEEVFSFLADYRNIPRLQPQFTSARLAGDVARGLGAVVELEGRFRGFPMKVQNRIIAFDPPSRLVSIGEGSVLSRSTWEVQPLEGNPATSRVSLTVDYKLRDTLGGLFMGMGSALWPIFNREIQGMTTDSLRRLQSFFADRAKPVPRPERGDNEAGAGHEE